MISGGREHELREINRLAEVFALIDSEKTSAVVTLEKARQDFKDSCEAAGIRCHVTERRATENYFTDTAVKKAKSNKYQALNPFDRLDDAPEPRWGKSENWLIAREMSADDWLQTDLGRFLKSI